MSSDAPDACLTDDQLELAAAGRLADDALQRHSGSCPVCRAALDEIRANNDFLGRLSPQLQSITRADAAARLTEFAIPGYRILGEAHRGGQGVVYKAVQTSTGQEVAIKVLHAGPLARAVDRARFEREVQILAQLNHPNIVAIHDCGATSAGYYLVMPYVAGVPLLDAVRERRMSLDQTLRLFATVCESVAAAHLHGVMHRDLKPANILVDAGGQPHVLDFGLAKLTGDDRPDESEPGPAVTVTGNFMGSLPWASPEQAEALPGQIDLRTDVYSLGVLLYQMLTGAFPYEVTGRVRDVLDNIIRATPPGPSSINPQCDYELDTIALKALAKEKQRRYQTVDALRKDVLHYLAGEPLDARRDSAWYVLRKTAGRYRVAVVVASAFLVLLVAFTVSLALQVRQTARERDRAQREQQVAEREADKARQTRRFIQNILASASPERAGADYTVQTALDDAARLIEAELGGQPEVEAAVRNTIASAYHGLGLYDRAEQHARAALAIRRQLGDARHASEVAESLNTLAGILLSKSGYAAAEPLFREALEIVRGLSDGPDLRIAKVLNDLGMLLLRIGDLDEAEAVLNEALAIRAARAEMHDPEVAETRGLLALLAIKRGDYEQAETLRRSVLETRKAIYGENHIEVAYATQTLGGVFHHKGELDAAEELYRRSLAMQREILGADHPDVADALITLAVLRFDQGDAAGALTYYDEAREICAAHLAEDHADVARIMSGIGTTLRAEERYAEAEAPLRRALAIYQDRLGPAHPKTAQAVNNLALWFHEQGDLAQAEPLYVDAIEIARRAYGPRHPEIALKLSNLAGVYFESGDLERAADALQQVIEVQRATLPARHWMLANSLRGLGICLMNLARHAEAEPVFLECHEILSATLDAGHPQRIATLQALTSLYETLEDADAVAEYQRLLEAERNAAGAAAPSDG